MPRLGLRTVLNGVAAAALLSATCVQAQDLNAAPPAKQAPENQIPEVVVTAQRREENLQKVPLAEGGAELNTASGVRT